MLEFIDLNGDILGGDKRKIMVSDLAFMRSHGIFDFFPIRYGKAVFEDDYFDRFYSSAQKMNLLVPINRKELRIRIHTLSEENQQADGFIKLILTGGYSPDGFRPAPSCNLVLIQYAPIYHNGISPVGVNLRLQRYDRYLPSVKSLNYSNSIRQFDQMQAANQIDVLYHNGKIIAETSRANFFIIDQYGKLKTSKDSLLQGITRKQLLKVAQDIVDVDQQALLIDDIVFAKEAFITSTTKLILPVTQINRFVIADGQIGPVSKKLYIYLDRFYQDHIEKMQEN